MLFAGPPAPLWHASDHQSMLSCHIMIHCEPRNILENVNGIFSLGFITVHIFIYTLMIFYWSSWEPKLWQWQETNPAASAGICIQPAVLLLISDRRFANICFHSWTKIKKWPFLYIVRRLTSSKRSERQSQQNSLALVYLGFLWLLKMLIKSLWLGSVVECSNPSDSRSLLSGLSSYKLNILKYFLLQPSVERDSISCSTEIERTNWSEILSMRDCHVTVCLESFEYSQTQKLAYLSWRRSRRSSPTPGQRDRWNTIYCGVSLISVCSDDGQTAPPSPPGPHTSHPARVWSIRDIHGNTSHYKAPLDTLHLTHLNIHNYPHIRFIINSLTYIRCRWLTDPLINLFM